MTKIGMAKNVWYNSNDMWGMEKKAVARAKGEMTCTKSAIERRLCSK
jgi:hypothetical protein